MSERTVAMKNLTRKSLEQFPEVMFVAKKEDRDSEWFQANEEAEGCMDDDGPTIVAHYKLTGLFQLKKMVRTLQSVTAKNGMRGK